MNVTLNPINSLRVTLGTSAIVLSALSLSYCKDQPVYSYTPSTLSKQDPFVVGVQSLAIQSDTAGIAVIKLDDFRVQVSFEYKAHPDNYGVAGSEFTAVDITDLSIDGIKDTQGNEFRDFTDHNDVIQVKELIRGYIEKNQLVEAENM
ncbi:hypothetical protein [Acinetobacter stercoris]|uniref:Uncharacterized protein n=1 Tax=Acinetobacter stercoris TaxID=2126983 RepID=A0A2U3MVJ1_9GAMM|nr:hypothetical protein [Acinetobacter stercoris]SPL69319.1 hypothetical protein KPC_0497 [Acinetobacter stercoris]